MNTLKTYVGEIKTIARVHNTDISIAADMFLANIRNAGDSEAQYDYTVGTGFDYAALKPNLNDLQNNKQEFIDNYR